MTPERPRTLIGPLVATVLYASLLVFALLTLRGKPLLLAVIIVLGLAVKSYLHYWREKSASNLDEKTSTRQTEI